MTEVKPWKTLPEPIDLTDPQRWTFFVVEWIDAKGWGHYKVYQDEGERDAQAAIVFMLTPQVLTYTILSDMGSREEVVNYVGDHPQLQT